MKKLLILSILLLPLTLKAQSYKFKVKRVTSYVESRVVINLAESVFDVEPTFDNVNDEFTVVCKVDVDKKTLKKRLKDHGYKVTYFRKRQLVKAFRDK